MSRVFHHRGTRWDSRSTAPSTTQWERERKRGPILSMNKPTLWARLTGRG